METPNLSLNIPKCEAKMAITTTRTSVGSGIFIFSLQKQQRIMGRCLFLLIFFLIQKYHELVVLVTFHGISLKTHVDFSSSHKNRYGYN